MVNTQAFTLRMPVKLHARLKDMVRQRRRKGERRVALSDIVIEAVMDKLGVSWEELSENKPFADNKLDGRAELS